MSGSQIPYDWLADLALLVHLIFVIFVAAGGLLVIRRAAWAWLHLPAAVWGAAVEFFAWPCPLTPLENRLREMAGTATYEGGFLERYLVAIVYPDGLTREMQLALGVAVVAMTGIFYSMAWSRYRRARRS